MTWGVGGTSIYDYIIYIQPLTDKLGSKKSHLRTYMFIYISKLKIVRFFLEVSVF